MAPSAKPQNHELMTQNSAKLAGKAAVVTGETLLISGGLP